MSVPHTTPFPKTLALPFATMTDDREVRRRIALYDSLAVTNGWQKVRIKTNNTLAQRLRYRRTWLQQQQPQEDIVEENVEFVVLDCWPTTRMIASYLKHPKQGRTQLFRAECTDEDASLIFRDPRSHIGKGYQQKTTTATNISFEKKRGRDEDEDDAVSTSDQAGRNNKRRQVACRDGQHCRNWDCAFYHPPRCFFAVRCYWQPDCWFDHTHGLCRYGMDCHREDCWFSHRNPELYY